MAAIGSIDTRLKRLESKTDLDNPYADWTDEELSERLSDLYSVILAGIGGDERTGYALFRDWYGEPTPGTLDGFIKATTGPRHTGQSTYEGALLRFMAHHYGDEIGTLDRH